VESKIAMRVLAILAGVILLLPGLCSIIAPLIFLTNGEEDAMMMIIFFSGILITWLAGWLIAKAGKPKEPQ